MNQTAASANYAATLLTIQHAPGAQVKAGQSIGTVAAVYTTWFAGCFTAGSQGQPAAHTRYSIQMPGGLADVPAAHVTAQ